MFLNRQPAVPRWLIPVFSQKRTDARGYLSSMSAPSINGMQERLSALVELAVERSRETGRATLVSVSQRLDDVDLLDALNTLAAGVPDDADAPSAMRMYWSHVSGQFELAGFGAASVLAPAAGARFDDIDRGWKELMREALRDDSSEGARGAEPALMGGFSFDPERPRTSTWRDFPPALFFLPRIQLARAGTERVVTLNVLVTADAPTACESDDLLACVRKIEAIATGETAPDATNREALHYFDTIPPQEWREMVSEAVSEIQHGTIDKVVLAREERAAAPNDLDVTATVQRLRTMNPTSYVFGFWHRHSAFVGATPERLVRLERGTIEASSLAGSIRRGGSDDDDMELALTLRASEKDRREHEIVRNALLSDLAPLCDDVEAEDDPSILTLKDVHHLHTAVRGRLRAGYSLLDVLKRLHPSPAVGGEPRDEALEFIRKHERLDRGWYAGPIGWLQSDRGEFAVALRSAVISGNTATLFAGCGIVADSLPEEEFDESLLKLRPMELALGGLSSAAQP